MNKTKDEKRVTYLKKTKDEKRAIQVKLTRELLAIRFSRNRHECHDGLVDLTYYH